MQAMMAPLTPPPKGLALASKSSPWSTIWRMLGIVLLLYVIAQVMILSLFGIVEGDSALTIFSLVCSVPLLLIFIFARRPKLTHVVVANPSPDGKMQHLLPDSRMLMTSCGRPTSRRSSSLSADRHSPLRAPCLRLALYAVAGRSAVSATVDGLGGGTRI